MCPSLSMVMVRSRKSVVFDRSVVFHVRSPKGRSFFRFSNSSRSVSLFIIQIPKMSSMKRLNKSRFLLYFGKSVSFSWIP